LSRITPFQRASPLFFLPPPLPRFGFLPKKNGESPFPEKRWRFCPNFFPLLFPFPPRFDMKGGNWSLSLYRIRPSFLPGKGRRGLSPFFPSNLLSFLGRGRTTSWGTIRKGFSFGRPPSFSPPPFLPLFPFFTKKPFLERLIFGGSSPGCGPFFFWLGVLFPLPPKADWI